MSLTSKGFMAFKPCLILLIVLYLHETQGSDVVLRVKNWDPKEAYKSIPLAWVPVGKTVQSSKLSFCFRFQIYGIFGKQIGLSDYDEFLKFGVWFRFQDNYGFVFLNGKALIFNIPEGIMRPYSWYHFCFSIDNSHYTVVANGNLWLRNKLPARIKRDISIGKLAVVGSGPGGKYRNYPKIAFKTSGY